MSVPHHLMKCAISMQFGASAAVARACFTRAFGCPHCLNMAIVFSSHAMTAIPIFFILNFDKHGALCNSVAVNGVFSSILKLLSLITFDVDNK